MWLNVLFVYIKELAWLRFEILIAVSMMLVLTLCGFVDRYQRFGETCCLHLQGRRDKAGKWRTEKN
jgi:hypothetical protein